MSNAVLRKQRGHCSRSSLCLSPQVLASEESLCCISVIPYISAQALAGLVKFGGLAAHAVCTGARPPADGGLTSMRPG